MNWTRILVVYEKPEQEASVHAIAVAGIAEVHGVRVASVRQLQVEGSSLTHLCGEWREEVSRKILIRATILTVEATQLNAVRRKLRRRGVVVTSCLRISAVLAL